MSITEVLIAEHRIFLTLFDQIEQMLPQLAGVTEVKFLSHLLEGMLLDHLEAEDHLAELVSRQIQISQEQVDRLNQYHLELGRRLARIQELEAVEEARGLVISLLEATRAHIKDEEQNVFPQLEAVLQEETLDALGETLLARRLAEYPGLKSHRKSKSAPLTPGETRNITPQFTPATVAI